MVNTDMLNSKIVDSGLKTAFIVDKLGISRQAFDKKKKNKIPFRVAEIYVVSDLLGLNDDEKQAIFFAEELTQVLTREDFFKVDFEKVLSESGKLVKFKECRW